MTATRIPDTLSSLEVPVSDLVPYDRNPRRGDVDVIAESLSANGQYRPIVVRSSSNEVLAGNHTLAAARQLGWETIAATFVDVDDDQAARIVLIDNRAGDLATNDDRELLALLRELEVTEAALMGTGYGADDLDDLAALASEVEQAQQATRDPSGDGDATDENAWNATSLKEYAERYEEQGRRLIVLDYDRGEYAQVAAALDRLRAELDVDSNSQALSRHLADRYPEVVSTVGES